jgi:predicted metalloprotease with PDZ domain
VTCASPASKSPQPTEYFVSLANYSDHNAHVSIRFTQASGTFTLDMPVWNALYQVRNFAINVEDVRAQGAAAQKLRLLQTKASEWQITPTDACAVVDYDIHLDAGGPFGTQLNQEHGFFNWAMVLMYSPATRSRPASVQFLDVPANWALHDVHVFGEAPAGKVEQPVGVANSYDELVDSPAEVGVFQHFEFQQDGATYHIVVHAGPSDYDKAKLEDILRRITNAQVEWMADRPFDSYTFLYHFPHGHGAGGMEHAFGTAIDLNADRLGNVMAVASVSSHEFFHLWNVKRIRPQALQPVDYQSAMDTRSLWFCEGLTSTVGDLMLSRAGLLGERQYIDRIASEINELQLRPARLWQSVEESGLQAWFEGNAFYRTPGRSISYYNKGEVVGVLLDLRIRQLTNGKKSLRDLFRWMNDNYAKKGLFFPGSDGVQQAAETVTGQSFADFFRDYVAGVREFPYNDFFSFVGLQVAESTSH